MPATNPAGPATAHRVVGLVTMVESLLIFVPLIVLGAAIEWPGSLGDPAELALPRLAENETATRVGYLVYLLYSVAFLPVAIGVATWRRRSGPPTIALLVAVGAAAASALARTIGISRWLAAAFPLAEQWEAASSDSTREAIRVQFTTVNDYGGAIGEILGVSIFAVVWLVAVITPPGLPRWARVTGGVVAAAVAAPAVELAGIDSGALVSVSSASITIWLLAVGVAMVRSPGPAGELAPGQAVASA